jgi:hypothetical protein
MAITTATDLQTIPAFDPDEKSIFISTLLGFLLLSLQLKGRDDESNYVQTGWYCLM